MNTREIQGGGLLLMCTTVASFMSLIKACLSPSGVPRDQLLGGGLDDSRIGILLLVT